jgi:hypothetical protein
MLKKAYLEAVSSVKWISCLTPKIQTYNVMIYFLKSMFGEMAMELALLAA